MRRIGGHAVESHVWISEGNEIMKSMTCYIPKKIRNVMRTLNTMFETDEFSIFVKCKINWETRSIDITNDWFIPTQTVSSAHIDYQEDNPSFNGVIHRHPGKMKNFSVTDDTYINSNFQVSIIWVPDEFGEGRVNVPTPAGRVQLPLRIECEADFIPIPAVLDLARQKISKHVIIPTVVNKFPTRETIGYIPGRGVSIAGGVKNASLSCGNLFDEAFKRSAGKDKDENTFTDDLTAFYDGLGIDFG